MVALRLPSPTWPSTLKSVAVPVPQSRSVSSASGTRKPRPIAVNLIVASVGPSNEGLVQRGR